MKKIFKLTLTNIRRNKLAVLLSVGSTAILCLIIWVIGNLSADAILLPVKTGIIDYDQSALSEDFKAYLTQDLKYEVLEDYSYDELSRELLDKNISVIIEIPENFYGQYASGGKEDLIITSMSDYENAAFIEVYINSYMSSIAILSKGAAGDPVVFDRLLAGRSSYDIPITQSAVSIDRKELVNKEGFLIAIGFYLMIIFAFSAFLAFMVLDDRQSGVYNRIQITPVKPVQYIIGTGLLGLFLCFLQIGIFCGYLYLAEIDTGIPMQLIILIMGLFAVFTVCFSVAIAIVLNSKNAATTVIIGFSTIGCILGGAYFPIELAPKTLQNLAKVMPQFWFMDAFRSLQADNTANVLPNITILILFSILSLLIGAVLFSQSFKTK